MRLRQPGRLDCHGRTAAATARHGSGSTSTLGSRGRLDRHGRAPAATAGHGSGSIPRLRLPGQSRPCLDPLQTPAFLCSLLRTHYRVGPTHWKFTEARLPVHWEIPHSMNYQHRGQCELCNPVHWKFRDSGINAKTTTFLWKATAKFGSSLIASSKSWMARSYSCLLL